MMVYNYISITGPTNMIKELWDTTLSLVAEDSGLGLLQAMIPIPREIDPRDRGIYLTYNGPNLWTWKSLNWGVKSDVDDISSISFNDEEHEFAELSGWFYTEITAPLLAYKGFLAKHPECRISAWYHEPSWGFAGSYVNGQHDWLEDDDEHRRNDWLELYAHLYPCNEDPETETEGIDTSIL